MKIKSKIVLRELVLMGVIPSEPVNGKTVISDGDDIVVDANGDKRHALLDDITPEELNLMIQTKQLKLAKSTRKIAIATLILVATIFAVCVAPLLLPMLV